MTYHTPLSSEEYAAGKIVIHHSYGVCTVDTFTMVTIYNGELNCLRLYVPDKKSIVFVPQNRIAIDLRRAGTEIDVQASFTILTQPRAIRKQHWNQILRKLRDQLRNGQLRELAKVVRDTFTINEWSQEEQYIYEEALVRLSQEIALITNRTVTAVRTAIIETLTTKHFSRLREI